MGSTVWSSADRGYQTQHPRGVSGSSAALPTPRALTYPLARVSNWPWVPLDARGSSQSLRDKKEKSDVDVRHKRGTRPRQKRSMWPKGTHQTEEGHELGGAHQTQERHVAEGCTSERRGAQTRGYIRQTRGMDWEVVSIAEVWESGAWFGSTLQSGDLDILRQATGVPAGNISNKRKAASIIYSPQGLLGQGVPLRTYPVGSDTQS